MSPDFFDFESKITCILGNVLFEHVLSHWTCISQKSHIVALIWSIVSWELHYWNSTVLSQSLVSSSSSNIYIFVFNDTIIGFPLQGICRVTLIQNFRTWTYKVLCKIIIVLQCCRVQVQKILFASLIPAILQENQDGFSETFSSSLLTNGNGRKYQSFLGKWEKGNWAQRILVSCKSLFQKFPLVRTRPPLIFSFIWMIFLACLVYHAWWLFCHISIWNSVWCSHRIELIKNIRHSFSLSPSGISNFCGLKRWIKVSKLWGCQQMKKFCLSELLQYSFCTKRQLLEWDLEASSELCVIHHTTPRILGVSFKIAGAYHSQISIKLHYEKH